ncbi:hypothetical protein SKAU_G00009640 [Synaphobranchus kaupii]|uniref:Uncharacterized protein n=1 Tax=Synaphobranchus kaupii TaxID=118154 RepID=A0A9Q1JB26_SYNKA|nr:hypothetical protein SKAU_G00009640 [Synaphobranchus kaupii]
MWFQSSAGHSSSACLSPLSVKIRRYRRRRKSAELCGRLGCCSTESERGLCRVGTGRRMLRSAVEKRGIPGGARML